MGLFLGVDGGQSSTTALIGDETGRVLGRGAGGPCNHVGAHEGKAKLISAVAESTGAACRQAGLTVAGIVWEAACFGFSGGPEDKEAILRETVPAQKMEVTTDAAIALSGATAGRPGAVVIAGTGSICYGRNSNGKTARAGGWGYLFGDEGGAFDLARQALRACLRQEEGWGPETALHTLLLEVTGARSANHLLHRLYTEQFSRPQFASLSGLVSSAAALGDTVARDLLTAAGAQLAGYLTGVRRQLFAEGEAMEAAYIGGVFRNDLLRERFRMLAELESGTRVSAPVYGPAAGALLEAYRAAGVQAELRNVPAVEKQ